MILAYLLVSRVDLLAKRCCISIGTVENFTPDDFVADFVTLDADVLRKLLMELFFLMKALLPIFYLLSLARRGFGVMLSELRSILA